MRQKKFAAIVVSVGFARSLVRCRSSSKSKAKAGSSCQSRFISAVVVTAFHPPSLGKSSAPCWGAARVFRWAVPSAQMPSLSNPRFPKAWRHRSQFIPLSVHQAQVRSLGLPCLLCRAHHHRARLSHGWLAARSQFRSRLASCVVPSPGYRVRLRLCFSRPVLGLSKSRVRQCVAISRFMFSALVHRAPRAVALVSGFMSVCWVSSVGVFRRHSVRTALRVAQGRTIIMLARYAALAVRPSEPQRQTPHGAPIAIPSVATIEEKSDKRSSVVLIAINGDALESPQQIPPTKNAM